jgi:hypothetical protein
MRGTAVPLEEDMTLKPYEDATEDLEINVTRTICSAATARDPFNCAASLAIRTVLGRQVRACEVLRNVVKVELRKSWRRYRTSTALKEAITTYDRTGQFPEGKYILKAMPHSWQLDVVKVKNMVWGDRRPYDERVKLAKAAGISAPPDPKYSRNRRDKAGLRHPVRHVRPRGAPGYAPPP